MKVQNEDIILIDLGKVIDKAQLEKYWNNPSRTCSEGTTAEGLFVEDQTNIKNSVIGYGENHLDGWLLINTIKDNPREEFNKVIDYIINTEDEDSIEGFIEEVGTEVACFYATDNDTISAILLKDFLKTFPDKINDLENGEDYILIENFTGEIEYVAPTDISFATLIGIGNINFFLLVEDYLRIR